MNIIFATSAEKQLGTASDLVWRERLQSQGVTVEYAIWTDPNVDWSRADAVMVRSTWDYHNRLSEFLNWAERVDQLTCLINPAETLIWNSSKTYLADLEKRDCLVVPTAFAETMPDAVAVARKWLNTYGEIVVKPAVTANSYLTFRIQHASQIERALEQALQRKPILIQPFIASVQTDGEISLIFFRSQTWEFSHATLKCPNVGDFRVQEDHGGTTVYFRPDPSLIQRGIQIASALPVQALYARIDLLNWKRNAQISEVELIEPDLYLQLKDSKFDQLERRQIEGWINRSVRT